MGAHFQNQSSLLLFKLWEAGERTQVSVVGEIMIPKYSQVLCPQTYEYVTIHGKKKKRASHIWLSWCFCNGIFVKGKQMSWNKEDL